MTVLTTYNVRGAAPANRREKPRVVKSLLRRLNSDIAVLTETHSSSPKTDPFLLHPNHIASYTSNRRTRGITVLLSPTMTLSDVRDVLPGQLLAFTATNHSHTLHVLAAYAPSPPKDRRRFIRTLLRFVPSANVLLGDLNFSPSPLDNTAAKAPTPLERALLSTLVQHGYRDITTGMPTHRSHNSASRIDHIWTSVAKATTLSVPDPGLSDHSPIAALLPGNPTPKSPVWKLPRPLLTDSSFLDDVDALAAAYADLPPRRLVEAWDNLKSDIRALATRHRRKPALYPRPISDLEVLWNVSIASPAPGTSPALAEALLADHELKVKQAQLASDHAGAVPSKWLTSRIVSRTVNRVPPLLSSHLGGEPTTAADALATFYRDLYAPKHVTFNGLASRTIKMAPDETETLRVPPTPGDVAALVSSQKKLSSPGPDGLPYELYQKSPFLSAALTALFRHVWRTGHHPPSWSQGQISPIHKDGKDPSLASSYRPIALLNTDYKCFTALLNKRLLALLAPKFPAHQAGFLPGRGTHLAAQRLSLAMRQFPDSVTVLLDGEKAYDRVSHVWLDTVLRDLSLPPSLLRFVNSVHAKATTFVSAAGCVSAVVDVMSGVRQGDPLAPLLFNLTLEPLLAALEEAGILTQAFADDTAVVVPPAAMEHFLSLLALYEALSGAKVNLDKSVALGNSPTPHPFRTAPEDRYLGFWLTSEGALTIPPALLREAEALTREWSRLPLSYLHRVTLVRAYLRPKILYHAPLVDLAPVAQAWKVLEDKFITNDPTGRSKFLAKDRAHHPTLNLGLPPLHLAAAMRAHNFSHKHSCPLNRSNSMILSHYLGHVPLPGDCRVLLANLPVPLSPKQREWMELFDVPAALRTVAKLKLRPAIKAHLYKRLMAKATRRTPCPLCGELETHSHLDICPQLPYAPNLFTTFGAAPRDVHLAIEIWSRWRVRCAAIDGPLHLPYLFLNSVRSEETLRFLTGAGNGRHEADLSKPTVY
eukprot:TRINITY_DN1112_c0_g1_i1.p1 TRINITY_DN1112_c0_g1~~TRINITY_DN1112_c0_g1_i1.p1  ORF type:complete len:989 (-),score=13.20 TRINITY_DN1112_c0_g1_i1:36-3002(-)